MNNSMFKQHLTWFFGSLVEEYLPPTFLVASLVCLGLLVLSSVRTGYVTVPRHWLIALPVLAWAGGVSGWMLANSGVDRSLHNTYYVMAHFHYVLGIVAYFGGFAAWYAWVPKLLGFQYDRFLAKLHFWLTCVGTALLFFPQHFLGIAGMPRNYADYPDAFAKWNEISTYGGYIVATSLALFVASMFRAFVSKHRRV
jgi:cytochrome c oxidase subunit I